MAPSFHCLVELAKHSGVRFANIFCKATEAPISVISAYNKLHFSSYVMKFPINYQEWKSLCSEFSGTLSRLERTPGGLLMGAEWEEDTPAAGRGEGTESSPMGPREAVAAE